MSILLYSPPQIAIKSLCRVFEHSGLSYEVVTNEKDCLRLAQSSRCTVLLVIHTESLELLIEFYEKWRASKSKAAFIVLTQRQSGIDRVRALEVGMKEYHITPFSYTELVKDVAQYEYNLSVETNIIEVHGLSIDSISRAVKFQGRYLTVTKKQFELLLLLMRYPGKVHSRVQIWEHVWANGEYPLANTVDVHINRLRKRLPTSAARLIETVYGFGYRLKPR